MNFTKPSRPKLRWPFNKSPSRPLPRLMAAMHCAALCLSAGSAWASGELDELLADQVSVRELMRLETAQALQRARGSNGYGAATGSSAMAGLPVRKAGAGVMRLVAIYGVGRKLMAEVQVDGQTLLFMRGRLQAVGLGKAHEMRLLGMNSRCVELALGERRESLCAPVSQSVVD